MDNLDKCYYWHIVMLKIMKCKLKELKGGKNESR